MMNNRWTDSCLHFKSAVLGGLLAVALGGMALPAHGQATTTDAKEPSIITSSRMIGIGGTNILDTYLSDEHFKGLGFSFLATVEYQKPARRWSTLLEHEANFSTAKSRGGTQRELEGAYNLYCGRLRRWQLMDGRLTLQAGAVGNLSAGFIYNTSNSNNPAQARLHLSVMPTAVATCRFQVWGKPLVARYELNLPLCGIQFSPNYGQSYYEIFSRGNYDHNLVPTTFVAAPEWRQTVTLDATLTRRLTLRIGYLGNIQQSKVNNLRQHIWTHRFLIGFTKTFSITPRSL